MSEWVKVTQAVREESSDEPVWWWWEEMKKVELVSLWMLNVGDLYMPAEIPEPPEGE